MGNTGIDVRGALCAISLLLGCQESAPLQPESDPLCRLGRTTMPADAVPGCLHAAGIITAPDRDVAYGVLVRAAAHRDTLRSDTAIASYYEAAEITRAIQRITDYYARDLFRDSARFHRMVDHVLVTEEYVDGSIRWVGGRGWPQTTPYLSWAFYPNVGIYFQPVNTVQSVAYLQPRATVPTDSFVAMGEQFYRYAMWRTHGGRRFPVWEYLFTWNSGGVTVLAPWISSQAQGYGLILFAENYRRTGNTLWRDRAYEVLNSFRVLWDDGGVLLPDTTHGYWWEEFHPTVFIWNGAAQALLAVGQLWRATDDPEVKRMFDRGVEALKYYTPEFDTGSWTLYSRTQGYNTVAYHNSHIQIMDALHAVSGDPWFKEVADRWRTYTPPFATLVSALRSRP